MDAGAWGPATAIVVDEIGNQANITASASTSSGHLLLMMMQMKLLLLLLLQGRGRRTGVAAAATTAVVTFPFIERKMRLGLVEGVLQLADAPPAITCCHERLLPLLMLKFVELDRSECCHSL